MVAQVQKATSTLKRGPVPGGPPIVIPPPEPTPSLVNLIPNPNGKLGTDGWETLRGATIEAVTEAPVPLPTGTDSCFKIHFDAWEEGGDGPGAAFVRIGEDTVPGACCNAGAMVYRPSTDWEILGETYGCCFWFGPPIDEDWEQPGSTFGSTGGSWLVTHEYVGWDYSVEFLPWWDSYYRADEQGVVAPFFIIGSGYSYHGPYDVYVTHCTFELSDPFIPGD